MQKALLLKINNFIGIKVVNMENMFDGYKKLISLDLNEFIGSNTYMVNAFSDHIKLEYINISKLNTGNTFSLANLF